MKKFWFLVLALSCATCSWGYMESPTQIRSTPVVRNRVTVSPGLVETLLSEYDANAIETLSVTSDGDRLWSLEGELTQPLTGDLVQACLDYLRDHPRLFNLPEGMNEETFKVVRNEETAGGRHVSFQMMIDGYPVHDARIDLHIGADFRIRLAQGSFPTVVRVMNTLRLGKRQAIERAKAILGTRALYARPLATMELHPLAQKGDFVSAYVVNLPSSDPLGSFRVTIDAETGVELDRENLMCFVHEGRGGVYRNHPLVSPVTVEPLPYLASTTLTGLYITMRNNKGPFANQPDSMHVYDPSDYRFDEANVYYHLNVAHDFFTGMGFKTFPKQVPAVVNYGDKLDNACYDAGFGVFGFGAGDHYNSFAREESIMYHEYSHYVMLEIVKVRNVDEGGAMNEGQADYFGSSMSNDPIHGEYVAAKAGLPYIRTLVNNFRYPGDIVGEVHKDGRIWSGALWDLRTAVGREVADRLIHASHFYLKPGRPTFRDGVSSLIAADANLFQGRNKAAITAAMSRRGITAAAFRGMVLEKPDLLRIERFRTLHRDK